MLTSASKPKDSLFKSAEFYIIVVPTIELLLKRKLDITLDPVLLKVMFLFSNQVINKMMYGQNERTSCLFTNRKIKTIYDDRLCCQLHAIVIFDRIRQAAQQTWLEMTFKDRQFEIYKAFICSLLLGGKVAGDFTVHNIDYIEQFKILETSILSYKLLNNEELCRLKAVFDLSRALWTDIWEEVTDWDTRKKKVIKTTQLNSLELRYLKLINDEVLIFCSPFEAQKMLMLACQYSQLASSARYTFPDKKTARLDFEQLQMQFEAKLEHFSQNQSSKQQKVQLGVEHDAAIQTKKPALEKERLEPESIPKKTEKKSMPQEAFSDPHPSLCTLFNSLSLSPATEYGDFKDGKPIEITTDFTSKRSFRPKSAHFDHEVKNNFKPDSKVKNKV